MSFVDTMSFIEGPRFRLETNVASDLRTFQRAVTNHPAVVEMMRHLGSLEAREQLFDRILALSRLAPDPRYENPADTPLSAYLLIMKATDPALAAVAAQAVAAASQCWWAAMIAGHILSKKDTKSSSGDTASTFGSGTGQRFSLKQTREVGDSLVSGGLIRDLSRTATVKVWSTVVGIQNESVAA